MIRAQIVGALGLALAVLAPAGSADASPQAGPTVVVLTDTNRDGIVTNADNLPGKDVWTASQGGIFYFNTDNDQDPQEDYKDLAVNGANDEIDLTRVVLKQYSPMPAGAAVRLFVDPTAAQNNSLRIYRLVGASWVSQYETGTFTLIPASDLDAGDVQLAIESRRPLSSSWNGYVDLKLEIKDSAGVLLGDDTVALRQAPPIVALNTWPTERLYVVDLGATNQPFRTTLQTVAAAAGITLIQIPDAWGGADRWVQDCYEPYVVLLPAATPSGKRRVDGVLQPARLRPLDNQWVPTLLGADFEVTERLQAATNPGESLNSFGNLEAVPPHTSPSGTEYPFGRIHIGGGPYTNIVTGVSGTRQMSPAYRDYLNACSLQGPYLETSTGWLTVAHVDEYSIWTPAPAKPRGWVVAFASPALARQILESIQGAGGGATIVFAGLTPGGTAPGETTVDNILADAGLMGYNQQVQLRLDAIKQVFKNEIGLADDEIIELPVLYGDIGGGEAAAYFPLMNFVPLPGPNGTIQLVLPDPNGPDFPTTDAWAAEAETRLEALGTVTTPVTVSFTDVWYSYHDLIGEAHCGTNTVRTPPDSLYWWNPTPPGPAIDLVPSSLAFTALQTGPPPPAQSFTVSNIGTTGTTLSWTATWTEAWIAAVTPASGSLPQGASTSVSVSVDHAGLAAGTYTGSIVISDPEASNSPRSLPVTLKVAGPAISVTPASLAFKVVPEDPPPAGQGFTVTHSGDPGTTLAWTATGTESWITGVTPSSGSLAQGASAPVSISVDHTGLPIGQYSGTIQISDPGASNNPRSVSITLDVMAPGAAIQLAPASIAFSVRPTDPPPAPQELTITNVGQTGSTLAWSATASQGWITGVAPASGSLDAGASAKVSISVNHAGLPKGVHTGTIQISDPASSNSPQTVAVTLAVGSPPVMTVTPTQLRISAPVGGPDPAPQTFTVKNDGPADSILLWDAVGNEAWLTLTPAGGTLASGEARTVQVSVSTAGLSAGTFRDTVVFTGASAQGSPQQKTVELVLAPATASSSTGKSKKTVGGPNLLLCAAPRGVAFPAGLFLGLATVLGALLAVRSRGRTGG